jgi:hypothetical protein
MRSTPNVAASSRAPEINAQIVVDIGTQNQGPEVLDLLRFPSPPLIPQATQHVVNRFAGGRTHSFRTKSIDDVVSRLAEQPANWVTIDRRFDPWPLPFPGVTCTGVWASLSFHPTYAGWSWTEQWPHPVAVRNRGDERTFRGQEEDARLHPDWNFPNTLEVSFQISMQSPVNPEDLMDWAWIGLDSLDPRVVSVRPVGGAFDSRTRQGSGWGNDGYFLYGTARDEFYQWLSTRLLRVTSITIGRAATLRQVHRDLGPSTVYKEISGDGGAEPLGLLRVPLAVLEAFKKTPPEYDWFLHESVPPAARRWARTPGIPPGPW